MVHIEQIVVRADRVCVFVRMAAGAHVTSPRLMQRVVQAFPSLAWHACVNEKGNLFGDVMNETPLPHLMEHMVIDLQTRAVAADSSTAGGGVVASASAASVAASSAATPASAADDVVYTGLSEWVDEPAGLARIEVSFTDDLIALRAFRDVVDFLNGLDRGDR